MFSFMLLFGVKNAETTYYSEGRLSVFSVLESDEYFYFLIFPS
jgi:hypothetical protein